MKSSTHSLLLATLLLPSITPAADPPKLNWNRFQVEGHNAFVILPHDPRANDIPWVLYAPTFHKRLPNARDEGWMITRFLNAGIAIAGIDVGESYGSPAGRALYNQLYETVRKEHNFGPKASLLARSRGGLMLYCWAVENPARVQSIAGIYPVCDLTSYPGLKRASGAYKLAPSELEKALAKHNPIPRLQSLAKAKIPIYHIHGDVDKVVPLAANSGALAQRYKELGGKMTLKIPPGQGHNMWQGFFQDQELVDFVIRHATANR